MSVSSVVEEKPTRWERKLFTISLHAKVTINTCMYYENKLFYLKPLREVNELLP